MTSLLKYTSDSVPKTSYILGRVSAKVVQIIVKFEILDFWQLFFIFVNMGPYGGKVTNKMTSPLKEHTGFAPQN